MEEKPISVRSKSHIIPKYSPTDIQAFRKCPLQYRFYNIGNLPQSDPVQLWFGEFIHNVMEKSYLIWKDNPDQNKFPWSFEKVQKISIKVSKELLLRNIKPNFKNFCWCYGENIKKNCRDNNHHKLANEIAFSAVNKWGKYLFPLMSDNEFKFQYSRKIQVCDTDRSGYYSIVGITDAIDSIKIQKSNEDNKLIQYLKETLLIDGITKNNSEFNIIIEYKGTSRPKEENNSDDSLWKQNERQVMTYMWLHDQKFKKVGKKAICGIILYLNELCPTNETVKELLTTEDVLRNRFHATENDIKSLKKEKRDLSDNSSLSENFLLRRTMHIVPYDEEAIENSLKDFDNTVRDIETCKHNEKINPENVVSCWGYNKDCDEPTRTACDLKGICGTGKLKLDKDVADEFCFENGEMIRSRLNGQPATVHQRTSWMKKCYKFVSDILRH